MTSPPPQQQQQLPASRTSPPHPTTPLFLRAENHPSNLALVDQHGALSYSDLLKLSRGLCEKITNVCQPREDDIPEGARISFLCPNDSSYVVTQWAIWMSGDICVPLSRNHPASEIQYFVEDSGSELLITTEEFVDKVSPVINNLGIKSIVLQRQDYVALSRDVAVEDGPVALNSNLGKGHTRLQQLLQEDGFRDKSALMMYTSGSTGRPKGVVHTHGSLQAQIDDMTEAWGLTSNDVILLVLPLHHIHGIVNVLMTSLNCGATCVMMTTFDPTKVWSMLLSSANPPSLPKAVNLFMAVPTIYAKLIRDYESAGDSIDMEFVKTTCTTKIRLMVSGSAALPQPIMDRWREITGHTLLERCGMTETGMLMTNPLHGQRLPGTVGLPFPRVEVCIAKENAETTCGYDVLAQGTRQKTTVTAGCEDEQGQLFVRGPNVFKGYWNRPQATQDAFTKDGWFKTGDTACYDHKNAVYKILGRTSVDIIKCGGYKISALDIERHLLAHPDITDVAVVGLPDLTWGEKVAAVVVLQSERTMELNALRDWAKDLLATYQLPTVLKVLDVMPRNSIGKLNKKELLKTVFDA